MSSPFIISVRTLFTIIFISLIPSHSNSPVTRSASRRLVMSGVVTRTASFAGVIAVIKPASIPAGQSMRINSGQPSWRDFKESTSHTRALPPKPIGSLDRGLEIQRSSKLDQRLSLTRAWSRRQSPLRTSTRV
ncbi:hypothetical protein CRG98_016188 [Punica granatum]|uniref:Secreted protein n=1 Tax=Punica granatum TaxID=22663 RepID=A0A2I0K4P4_PUNGR|nr:hypothetical protein CRG98_016188 [Punica granatum]